MKENIKQFNKRTGIIPAVATFVVVGIVSMQIIINYSRLYEDKQYADMITCSESLSNQVYNAAMFSFSKIYSLVEIVSAKGESVMNDVNYLENLKAKTKIKGYIFAPEGKISSVYPKESLSGYSGIDFSKDFPEVVSKETLLSGGPPIILGPYTVPGSTEKAMAVLNTYYKTGENGRENAGVVGILFDYPSIFEDVDFSEADKHQVLCKIWRYNEFTSSIQTILESKDKFPEKIGKNNTTVKKYYFTTAFSFSFAPKYTFWQCGEFYKLVITLTILSIITSFAVYYVINGLGQKNELKLYKVQSKLYKVQEHTIISLSNLVENRDSDTGEHIRRTSDYVYMIAQEARKAGLYKDIITDEYMETLKSAAPMHDIGKIVVPDAVLKKPGKLSPEEFDQIKLHTTEGGKIINDILGPVQNKEFVTITQQIAESHHEKWNGKGYPKGLSGTEIPLCARIMSLADVFDALTTPRCYKEPFSFEKAIEIIQEDAGVAFDPELATVFLSNQDKLKEIMSKYF